MKPSSSLIAVLAFAGCLVAAHADETSALQPKTYNQVSVVNGGVSLDEAAAVKRMANQYSLRVVISGRGGAYYVADKLSVMRQGEVVAQIPDAGPRVLMDLPPGQYQLRGEFNGTQLRRDVTVGSSGTTLNWVVPPSLD